MLKYTWVTWPKHIVTWPWTMNMLCWKVFRKHCLSHVVIRPFTKYEMPIFTGSKNTEGSGSQNVKGDNVTLSSLWEFNFWSGGENWKWRIYVQNLNCIASSVPKCKHGSRRRGHITLSKTRLCEIIHPVSSCMHVCVQTWSAYLYKLQQYTVILKFKNEVTRSMRRPF